MVEVSNLTRNTIVAERVGVADTSAARRRGLLRHPGLSSGEGLWIVPCEAVHTFGMKFPIDVLFLGRKRTVLKIRATMPAGRISVCLRAYSVLELAAGAAAATGTEVGDQLEFRKRK